MPKKAIIAVVVIAVIVVAAVIAGRRKTVGPGLLKVSGAIEATTVALSFKVGGRLAERLVDEGQTVTAGQVVGRLEDQELREEQHGRSADERATKAALADLEAGSRSEEIAQAEAVVAKIKADAERLARDAARSEELYKREVIPLKDLESARAGRDSSAAALREAEQRLKLLRTGPRPDAVLQARARAEGAAAIRTLAETRLSQAVLSSPLSGLVLSKHAEPGEMLAAGAPLLTVAKMDEVWLRGYIPESELGRVKLGQTARIKIDSWPERSFEGRVSFIASEAEFTPKNVQTEKERVKLVYRIKITLPNPKGELKPGMPADAVIMSSP